MKIEGKDCIFLTLRQCPRSHIYKVIPLHPFKADMVRDINNGITVATVAYVGCNSGNVLGVVFII